MGSKREIVNRPVSEFDARWFRAFGHLVKFKRLFGRWPTPTEKYPGRFRLGQWMYQNRQQHYSDSLDPTRLRQLQKIRCPLDPIRYVDQFWEYRFNLLQRFRKRHPDRWPYTAEEFPKGIKLGRWLREQRIKHTRGTLKKEFRTRLRSIGFPLKPITHHAELWQRQFLSLKKYRVDHPDEWPTTGVLGRWCFSQRRKRVTGHLSRQRVAQLNSIGFDWNSKESQWHLRLGQLAEYMRSHKGARPKAESAAEFERTLANWLAFQRSRYRRGLLEPDRIRKLNRLGLAITRVRTSRN